MAKNKIVAKNKKPGTTKALGRDYSKEEAYQSTPERIKYRSELNKKNRELQKKGLAKVGDKKDVSHVVAAKKGGTLKKGCRLEAQSKNRARK